MNNGVTLIESKGGVGWTRRWWEMVERINLSKAFDWIRCAGRDRFAIHVAQLPPSPAPFFSSAANRKDRTRAHLHFFHTGASTRRCHSGHPPPCPLPPPAPSPSSPTPAPSSLLNRLFGLELDRNWIRNGVARSCARRRWSRRLARLVGMKSTR